MSGISIKISEVIGGLIIFAGGLFFGVFILTLFAFPNSGIIVSSGPIVWIFEIVLPIVLMESGIYWIKQSLHMDTSKIENQQAS